MANTAVIGIYKTRADMEAAVHRLKADDFRNTDISILFPSHIDSKDIAETAPSKSPESTAVGAGAGAVIGGTLGWLAGIGSLSIPGAGPFIAAGPIMAAVTGAGVGCAVGGVAGALIGLGMPEYEAKRVARRVTNGDILLSVHCDNSAWILRAKVILQGTGAEDISTRGETVVNYERKELPHFHNLVKSR